VEVVEQRCEFLLQITQLHLEFWINFLGQELAGGLEGVVKVAAGILMATK
jgi:hypothetical protein